MLVEHIEERCADLQSYVMAQREGFIRRYVTIDIREAQSTNISRAGRNRETLELVRRCEISSHKCIFVIGRVAAISDNRMINCRLALLFDRLPGYYIWITVIGEKCAGDITAATE